MYIIIVAYSHTFHLLHMHIFHLSSFLMKFLHLFVLLDVVSSSIAGAPFISVVLSVTPVITELTEILNMILSYKSYLAFL